MATLNVDREYLILINGEVAGLQIPDVRPSTLFTPGSEWSRWGVAWVNKSALDAEVWQAFRMAADLLHRAPLLEDHDYQAMYRFLEYLLMLRDPESALPYIYPPFRDDADTWQYYRSRLNAIAYRSQIAERRGVYVIDPQFTRPDFGLERLEVWNHPITNQPYTNVSAWLVDVRTRDFMLFTVPVYTIEHEGEWYVLHIGDVL